MNTDFARMAVLAANVAHDYEHYGNMATYMRIRESSLRRARKAARNRSRFATDLGPDALASVHTAPCWMGVAGAIRSRPYSDLDGRSHRENDVLTARDEVGINAEAGTGDRITASRGSRRLSQYCANQSESNGARFSAASYVPARHALRIVVLMKRQAGGSHRKGRKNEPGLWTAGVNDPLGVHPAVILFGDLRSNHDRGRMVNAPGPNDRLSARIAIVEQHIRLENDHDLEGVLRTFGATARYDDQAVGRTLYGRRRSPAVL